MSAKFAKAEPQQARLKVSMYGPPGSGKTLTALLFAEGLARVRSKRIAYVDTERGTDFYAQKVPARAVHPEAFDFDAIYTKSLSDVTDAVRGLSPDEYGVVVLDSVSHLWEAAIEAYTGKKTKIDTIPMQAWGSIKKPWKALINFLIGSPFDVFILGRQKNVFENTADGEMVKVGVGMKAEGETPYEPHILMRLEARKIGDETVHFIHVEKDRTGVLSGRTLRNPSFATIEPLLPLLGDVQAPVEDDEDRAAKDSELMQRDADKDAQKAAKSGAMLAEFTAKLTAAQTLEDIGAISAAVKKSARYMLDEHLAALRELKSVRVSTLTTAIAGA